MNKTERNEFQRGRESTHSEMEQLRALATAAGKYLALTHFPEGHERFVPA